jgi:putative flavoprotein involved in K+ transport
MSRQGQTIVIGGGQAGLAVGYYLANRGIPFQILDANPRIGDAWRNRWDSLRLFTTARYAGLPGLPFPARSDAFPTKEEMADYLEFYAEHFHLPIQTGVKVEKLSKQGEHFVIEAGTKRFAADPGVVAMANYQVPKRPAFATDLHPSIIQLHSHDYRNPSQLQEGGVLIVGAGNSGADIGVEVARNHTTWISGKESGVIPFPIDGVMGRFVLSRVVRFLFHHVFTVNTPIGRKLRPKMLSRPAPLVRVKPKDLIKAGIKRLPRVIGARGGLPLLQDGYTLNVRNVIWCTGYHLGFSWIDLPIFDEDERLMHECGIVTSMPGMYFVGLHFLYAMSSATVMGVGRDAERIAGVVERHTRIGKTEDKERSRVAVVA